MDIRRTVNWSRSAYNVFSVRCSAGISNIDRSPFRYRELRNQSLERVRVSAVRQGEADDIRIEIFFNIISLEDTCIVLCIEAKRRKRYGDDLVFLVLVTGCKECYTRQGSQKSSFTHKFIKLIISNDICESPNLSSACRAPDIRA